VLGPVVEVALRARKAARDRKDWAESDAVRDELGAVGIQVRDGVEGMTWLFDGT
jgi:cysteinyl-tRNA synthetase